MNPRRFEIGFNTSFEGLHSFCHRHGFVLAMDKAWWTLQAEGDPDRPERMKRREAIRAIDAQIRIPAGLPPILEG